MSRDQEHSAFKKEFNHYERIVRRGLTIAVNKETKTERVLRKGFPKFFDLNIEAFFDAVPLEKKI
jgi:hypothetical protein